MAYSCRSTDSVGLAAATNKLEFTYAIQCISRHFLTYSVYEEHPIGDVKPMKLVVQYLTQAAIELPSAGDDSRQGMRLVLRPSPVNEPNGQHQ